MGKILKIVRQALVSRTEHLTVGTPMRYKEGFREANLAHDISWAFRTSGWYVFPEFPFKRGSIDAVFVKGHEVVVCEWKRLYRRAIPKIEKQTARLHSFNAEAELKEYNFEKRSWRVSLLWVCDSWTPDLVDWWARKPSKIKSPFPFNRSWETGIHKFASLGEGWSPYYWTWAIHEHASRFVWQDGDIRFIKSPKK